MKDFDLMAFLKKILGLIPWKEVALGAYKKLRIDIAAKVASTDAKWDDWLFEALDKVVLKFLGDDALKDEKDRAVLVEEEKAKLAA